MHDGDKLDLSPDADAASEVGESSVNGAGSISTALIVVHLVSASIYLRAAAAAAGTHL